MNDTTQAKLGLAATAAYAASAAPRLIERYTEWRSTDEAGFIVLTLVAVEVIAYIAMAVWYVVKIIRGRKQLVREERPEWRYTKRERVIATYSPATDKRHPNYRGRR